MPKYVIEFEGQKIVTGDLNYPVDEQEDGNVQYILEELNIHPL